MIRTVPVEPITQTNVEEAFQYQPWEADQQAAGKLVVTSLIMAMRVILENVPASPDRSAAIRKIREARMDCNSAITHRGRF